eukprot:g1654.t2
MAIVDRQNTLHIFQRDVRKDKIPCQFLQEGEMITCVLEYRNGLLLSGDKGSLAFFYRNDSWTETSHLYCQYRCLKAHNGISSLCISPSESTIIAILSHGHIANLNMEEFRMKEDPKFSEVFPASKTENPFELSCGSFTSQSVLDLDICLNSFTIAVVTAESRLILWNYYTRRCLVNRQLEHEALCISLHVSGLLLLIGMRDKLRLYKILLDDILLVNKLPVKKTAVVKFSNGGHLFATVYRKNIIQVYEVYSECKEPRHVLKGHLSEISDLCWNSTDTELVSVAAGGACYTWSLTTGQKDKNKEYINKNCLFNRVLPGPESCCFVFTHNGRIQLLREGKLETELKTEDQSCSFPAAFIREGNVLIYGTSKGQIISQTLCPFSIGSNHLKFTEERNVLKLHHHDITVMRLAQDSSFVVTCDAAGVVLVSKIQLVLDGVLIDSVMKPWDPNSSSVHLLSTELSSWKSREWELKSMVVSERKSMEYQMMKETQQLKEAVKTFQLENDELRDKCAKQSKKLNELKDAEATKREIALTELHERYSKDIEDLKSLHKKRQEVEFLKHNKLKNNKDDEVFALEEKIFKLKEEHKAEIQSLQRIFEATLAEKNKELEKLCQEKHEAENMAEKMIDDFEKDNDIHADLVQRKQCIADQEAEEERLKLKVDNNIMAKGILKLKSSKLEDSKQIRRLEKEAKEFSEVIKEQTEQLEKLQEQVIERDGVISANYETIQVPYPLNSQSP